MAKATSSNLDVEPNAKQYDLIGVGAIAVDELLYVDRYPDADAKVRVQRRERQAGGQTGTALVAATRFGARAAYAGQLGPDPLSRFIAETFERENVDLSNAVRSPDARPAHSTIIVDQTNQTRTIFSSVTPSGLGPDDHRPNAELLSRARVLLIDHHRIAATLRLAHLARELRVPIIADFERFYPVIDPENTVHQERNPDNNGALLRELMGQVDHLIVGQEFARAATGMSDPTEMVQQLWHPDRAAVVVTCGESGCWFRFASNAPPDAPSIPQTNAQLACHLPALAVDAIDTTGCGDVLHGVYAAELARGTPAIDCLRIAAAAASIKATRHGGQSGIPDRDETVRFLGNAESSGQ